MKKFAKPFVSIIISTKNESANIKQLLISLNHQTYSKKEIILVDNHSTDNTVTIAKKYIKHIFIQGSERSQQRNFGAKKARGEYLLFLDADMILAKNLLSDLIKAVSNKEYVSVVIPEDVRGNNFFSKIKKLEKRLYWNEKFIEAARFINRKTFRKIGGYNPQLIAGEDWDLHERLLSIGKITRIKTPLYHQENSFIKELQKKIYYAKNIKPYALIHPVMFYKQSGMYRVKNIFRNKKLLLNNFPVSLSLLLVKLIEYLIFLLIYGSSIFVNKNEK